MRRFVALVALSVAVSMALTAVAVLISRSELLRTALEPCRGGPATDAPEGDLA